MDQAHLALLAFGFGNLAMLGWLAAAGVPLVIHLWNRRRYREVPWAAMQFLLAAMRKNSRRMQLEEWILLAIRMGILALLALAVAEPFLQQSGSPWLSGQPVHRVLVVDGSYSMSYRPGDQDRFSQARAIAARIVEDSPQGDAFSLVLMAEPPRVVIGNPGFDRPDVLREIDGLALTHGGFDLAATLARVEELVERARRDYPRLSRQELYFLSDLTRAGWLSENRGAERLAEVRARSQRLARLGGLTLVDVGQKPSDQWAIADWKATEAWATTGREVVAEARVRHYGRAPAEPITLEILADGTRVGETSLELPSGGEGAVMVRHRFDVPGAHMLELRLPDDPLPVDNHRWLSVPVRERLRVLCVNGKPSGEAFGGATDYLTVALAPLGRGNQRSGVEVEVASENVLSESSLADFDCVFLANVAQFTADEAQTLAAYLRQGGGLVIFLGDQVRPEGYQRYLGTPLGDSSASAVLPIAVGEPVERSLYHFDPGDYRHPIVDDFQNQERAGLLGALVYQYQRLTLPENSSARVALRFQETGDPAVVEHMFERGRVFVVATSADASWNAWVMGPSYLPIVQEILALAVRGRWDDRNRMVGNSLGGAYPMVNAAVSVQIERPDGRTAVTEGRSAGGVGQWSYGDTDLSGVYTARLGPPLATSELVAVNVDTAESDLTPLDFEELKEKIWPELPVLYRTRWEEGSQRSAAQLRGQGSLHRPVLLAMVVLLLADTLISWYFGRARG